MPTPTPTPRKVELSNVDLGVHGSDREIWWLPWAFGLFVVGIGAWVLTQAPDPTITDSEQFRKALELWMPLEHNPELWIMFLMSSSS
jgi:hypothetical protein